MGSKRTVKKVKKKNRIWLVILFLLLCILAAVVKINWKEWFKEASEAENPQNAEEEPGLELNIDDEKEEGYAISSSSSQACRAGAEVLENGGNAVDAAIAMAYTLSVTEPYGSGLGGGGCMVVFDPDSGASYFYNYGAEAAQSGFSSQILIPGFVSGMESARTDLGTMELAELLKPAIEYCDGFEIGAEFETRIDSASGMLDMDSPFYQDGRWLREGDTLVQPELKQTLCILAEEGSASFYSGTIAEMLVQNTGMTKADLSCYETVKTTPVQGDYREYKILSAAAPYSGATLIQMLKMLEFLDIENPREDNSAFLIKLEQATLAAHADRLNYTADPRFGAEGEKERVTDSYVAELLNLDLEDLEIEDESEDTTGFTVIDKNGMTVACTNTLSQFWGSKVNVGGFYLNNSGNNFSSGVNGYARGKRPRTHISPTILYTDEEIIAIASPGGNAIVKVLAEVLTDVCRFGTQAQEAVDKRRVLFQNNGLVYYETGYDTECLAEIPGSGYRGIPSENHSLFGNVALSEYKKDTGYNAVTDRRRNGLCQVQQ